MLPIWIILLIFVSTSLLVLSLAMLIYDRLFRYRYTVRQRLNEVSDRSGTDRSVSLFKDLERCQSHDVIERLSLGQRLKRVTDEAGIECSVRAIFAWSIGTGMLLALAGVWRSWWLAAGLFLIGVAMPVVAMLMRRRARQRKLSRQLPEAFAMISRAVRAGQTVPAALQIIAEDFDPPISTEFALCYERQNLGMGRESALRKLATRSGIMELQIFVVALLVQAKSGGDLVELLDNLAAMIRKRLKLKDRVRALTGEGRMQALVLIVLPIAALLGIVVLAPEYAEALLDRPWLLAATASAQAAGAFWIRRIVNFDY